MAPSPRPSPWKRSRSCLRPVSPTEPRRAALSGGNSKHEIRISDSTFVGAPKIKVRRSPSGGGTLIAAVHRAEDWPKRPIEAVAFGGRSNVGKSSLLNRLIGAEAARTSKTPGRTQGVYLYESGEGWVAADLPGFGFAKTSRESRALWKELAGDFFHERPPLLTVQLIDPRIPTSDYDLDFRDYLHDLRLASIVVATKADRLNQSDRSGAARRMEKDFGPLLFVSAKNGEGIELLRKQIRQALAGRGRE